MRPPLYGIPVSLSSEINETEDSNALATQIEVCETKPDTIEPPRDRLPIEGFNALPTREQSAALRTVF